MSLPLDFMREQDERCPFEKGAITKFQPDTVTFAFDMKTQVINSISAKTCLLRKIRSIL